MCLASGIRLEDAFIAYGPCCLVVNLALLCWLRPASTLGYIVVSLSAYYDIEYKASKNRANADALTRLLQKTVEEPDDWSIEADQVNCVQMERGPTTVSQIREATRGIPVLSRTMYCILHGSTAENCIPDELKIYYSKEDEFYRRRWLHPSWYQRSESFQISG